MDEEAALWAVRLSGRVADAPDAEVEAWLAGDARRAGALLRAQAALSFTDRARALPQTSPARAAPLDRRGLLLAGGGGLAAAAVAGAAVMFRTETDTYSTALGEIRRVPLGDGSVAQLNTDSELQVAYSRRLRRLNLLRGEVWLSVGKDPARPFLVESDDLRVRAVGTAFAVHRAGPGLKVLVSEGEVEAWRTRSDQARVRAQQGALIQAGADGRLEVSEASDALRRTLAWRNGQIDLDGRTLGEAAEEFNRYNRRRIVIEDAGLARQELVGLFQTNEPDSFARAASLAFGARLTESGDLIRLGGAAP